MDSCLRCGGCAVFDALPVDSVRLSRAGSARARGEGDCVGTFQTGGWSVHVSDVRLPRTGSIPSDSRVCACSVWRVKTHDLLALFNESCGEAGADAAGHPDGEARDMVPSPR